MYKAPFDLKHKLSIRGVLYKGSKCRNLLGHWWA